MSDAEPEDRRAAPGGPDRAGDVVGAAGEPARGAPGGGDPTGGPEHVADEVPLNRAVARVMGVVVGIGIALLAIGLVLALADGETRSASVSLSGLLSGPRLGDDLLALGVLVLALAPASGVVVTVGGWLRRGERRYAALGIGVLVLLAAGALVDLVR